MLVSMAAMNAPDADFIVVLINHNGRGGTRSGSQVFVTLHDGFELTVIHELGHAIGNLADEYCSDDPDEKLGTQFPGPEPTRVNITTVTNPAALKWRDLVLSSTPIPTVMFGQKVTQPDDLVGTYEGANAEFCRGVYRPQPYCRMNYSELPFCSVCRRKLIRDLLPSIGSPLAVTLSSLLIRDTHEPWVRGAGDIYFAHSLTSNTVSLAGRWPGWDGDVQFDGGQERSLNEYFIGVVPAPRPGSMASLSTAVRDNDWPDDDDTLRDDATVQFDVPTGLDIDQPDYRLIGRVEAVNLLVMLDTVTIKNDQDPGTAGDIYIDYWISNGSATVQGRWPSSGTVGIENGVNREIGTLAASISRPPAGGSISIRVRVLDEDDWIAGGDDLIGDDTFTYDASSGFGTNAITHVEDRPTYRLNWSVVSP
jgi:hypothetical protein